MDNEEKLMNNIKYIETKIDNNTFTSELHLYNKFDISKYKDLCESIGLYVLNHAYVPKEILKDLIHINYLINISLVFDKEHLLFIISQQEVHYEEFLLKENIELLDLIYLFSYLLEQCVMPSIENLDFIDMYIKTY